MRLSFNILCILQLAAWIAPISIAADVPAPAGFTTRPASTQPDSASLGNFTIPDIHIDLIHLNAGTFTIGSSKSERERYTDEPAITDISLSDHYWLGKTEVTRGQWRAVMGNDPEPSRNLSDDAPVVLVSWTDAMDFCQKLTDRERSAGRLPEGYIYTLPTEAQWECACRAGTTTPYAGNLDDMAWYANNGGISVHPVAQRQPNAWGLYDMHGNAWEWTSTWYATGMLGRSGGKNPAGPTVGKLRVLRGGAFDMPAVPARSSYRFHLPPNAKRASIGFRIALTVPPVPEVPPPPGTGRGRRNRPQSQPTTAPQNAVPPDAQPQLKDLDPAQADPNAIQINQTPPPPAATQPDAIKN